jgi:hemolysin III
VFRLSWPAAPRWLYVLVYSAMGCGAVLWIGDFAAAGAGAAVMVLLAVGGALYLLGGLVYGVRRPNPSRRWFGFHEVFHSLTVTAYSAHYAAVSILVHGRR